MKQWLGDLFRARDRRSRFGEGSLSHSLSVRLIAPTILWMRHCVSPKLISFPHLTLKNQILFADEHSEGGGESAGI